MSFIILIGGVRTGGTSAFALSARSRGDTLGAGVRRTPFKVGFPAIHRRARERELCVEGTSGASRSTEMLVSVFRCFLRGATGTSIVASRRILPAAGNSFSCWTGPEGVGDDNSGRDARDID